MEKPDLILEAAAKRFALFGFRRTVMDDIARDAGIAKGSLYLHAVSKEDLFLKTVLRERQLMAEAAREAAAGHEDPREAVGALVRRFLQGLEERPLMGRLMTGDAEMGLGPELQQRLLELCNEDRDIMVVVSEALQRGVARGLFRADLSVEASASIVISIFHIHLYNKKQRFIELDDEVFTRELLRILFEGIQICERGFHEEH